MKIVPLSIKEAEEFLAKHERHYKASVEPICAIGILDYEENIHGESAPVLHGAAILGRKPRENSADVKKALKNPASILTVADDSVAELAHIYVDGTSQGYSLLYGACWRALKALGYVKCVL